MTDTLKRGDYELAHQSQMTGHDWTGERIVRHPGGRARGYRLTGEQLEQRRTSTGSSTSIIRNATGVGGLPYEFLLYTPENAATNWTAFYTRADLQKFLDAYGLALDQEPEPGQSFWVQFPFDTTVWQPLNDPGIADPVCPSPPSPPAPIELDESDSTILAQRAALLDAITTPKVGDWVQFADGLTRRISHIWDWNDGDPSYPLAQTSDGGSYYLGDGYVSMSGSLHPPVHTDTLTDAGITKPGRVWFFHHDSHRADNGVETIIPFRVWTCTKEAPK